MSVPTIPNNPAGRLLRICKQISDMQPNTKIRQAWAEITGVPSDDLSSLLDRVGAVLSLVEQAKQAIHKFDDLNHSLYLSWEEPVAAAFGQVNYTANVHQMKQVLRPEVIRSLEFCDHELSKRCPEPALSEEDLADVLKEVRSLSDHVRECDLSDELKKFLLDKLDIMERALELFMFNGARPVEHALHSVVGGLALSPQKREELIEVGLAERLWTLCGRLASLIALAEAGKKLLAAASESGLLGP